MSLSTIADGLPKTEICMNDLPSRKKRILLIDDQPSMTGMWRIFLEHVGYTVEEENRSQYALLTARRFQPDIMVLDMQMPVMDGREVAARIKADKELANVAVVFLTSVVTEREVAAGKRIDGYPCLPKPADCKALLKIIEANLVPAPPAPAKSADLTKITAAAQVAPRPAFVLPPVRTRPVGAPARMRVVPPTRSHPFDCSKWQPQMIGAD